MRFELRRASVGMGDPWVGTEILIEGELVSGDGVGPDPVELLEQLQAPLPARVQMRVCDCGHAGCWSLAATVRQESDEIVLGAWCDGVEDEGGFPSDPVDRPEVRLPRWEYAAALRALETLVSRAQ
jgi:hypothetical protein